MNDADWRRLLRQIRMGLVVPVVGSQLLVDADAARSLPAQVAEQVLALHGQSAADDPLPLFREVNEVVSRLRAQRLASLQDLYTDIHDAIDAVTARHADAVPPAIAQLAEIRDFRLFVTLTPDDLLARALRRRCAVNEVIHAPKLATSEWKDLPADWASRPAEVQLLYLFGKSSAAPVFAIHDEDVLEYAHNVIARGSQVPTGFLREIQERSLLLLGCNFPDWLSRFFLRLTNKSRLSEKTKREWLIEQLGAQDSLTCFLRSYSNDTEVLSDVAPLQFVAELHERWLAEQKTVVPAAGPAARDEVPRGAMFFISYSRSTDLPHAERLFQALQNIGVDEHEIWFDRSTLEPADHFLRRILDGIGGCRYFVPLVSDGVDRREEAFVFREWRAANERRKGVNRRFIVPLIVDDQYEPSRYRAEPVIEWSGIDFGHAPQGQPDERTLAGLRELVREARRPGA